MKTLSTASKLIVFLANIMGCQPCELSGSTLRSTLQLAESHYRVRIRWESFTEKQLNALIY